MCVKIKTREVKVRVIKPFGTHFLGEILTVPTNRAVQLSLIQLVERIYDNK